MIKIDPEFQTLIPPLTDDEYQRLEKSILAEGVRECIITWDGTIIDGHNRYRICQEHGLECPSIERTFKSRDAAKIWIIENQFARRNLQSYVRSVLALKLEPLYAAEAKRRQLSTLKQNATDTQKSSERYETREKVAAIAGVSHDTIRKVKVIESEAESGNEKAIAARESVIEGSKSINRAYNEITGKKKRGKSEMMADDGRRICGICNEPINPGEAYEDEPNSHKKCRNRQHAVAQRSYRDADRDLRENVAVFTVDSLVMELVSVAKNLRDSWAQSIEINESMGVEISTAKKERLDKAVANLFDAINEIKED